MIATHSTKLTNSKAQQQALCANIIADVPQHLICSKNIELQKKYYACPLNAAEMNTWREVSGRVNTGSIAPMTAVAQTLLTGKVSTKRRISAIPDITDSRAVKQILMPLKNWQEGGYLCVSPLSSMGLMRELVLRAKERGIWLSYHPLEVTPSAIANHGELLLDQGGKVGMLVSGVKNQHGDNESTTGVCLTFTAQDMNIASGFLAKGLPALTAIGGFVHVIERQTGQDIQFAVGYSQINFENQRRFVTYKSRAKPAVPNVTYESTGSGQVHLLLRCGDNQALFDALKSGIPNRFAGGAIFNENVTLLDDEYPPKCSYITPFYADVKDRLDSVLNIETWKQEAKNRKGLTEDEYKRLKSQLAEVPTILECGYGLLETPKNREKARANYPHAWAEPLYQAVNQSVFNDDCWFKRYSKDGVIYWDVL